MNAKLINAPALTGLLLLLLITLVYANHFHNSFHFDDFHTIVNNPSIRTVHASAFFSDGKTSSILPQNQSFRPIVTTSLAIDYWLGKGYNVFYFHLSTFIIFLIQGLLMLLLFNKVFQSALPQNVNIFISIAGVAWYMLHPAIAETINYIIARSDVQSTFFTLFGLILYVYSPFCKRTFLYLLPVATGILAKPQAAMFAPLLFFYLLFFEEQIGIHQLFQKEFLVNVKSAFKKIVPSLLVCFIFYFITFKYTPSTWQAGGASVFLYLITQPFVLLHYFGTLFLPLDLSADTDWQVLNSIWDIHFFTGMIFIILMIAAAYYSSKSKVLRPVAFGICWFFLALIPTSSIIPLAEVTNDHRMFFPFVGLVMSVTWFISVSIIKLFQLLNIPMQKYRRQFLLALTIFLGLYAYGTYERNIVWHTDESLWHDVTLKSPANGRGLMNFGLTKMAKGEYGEAELYFKRSIALLPYYSLGYINLGILKSGTGDNNSAENYFQKAIQLGSDVPDTWFYYGKFLYDQQRYTEAEAKFSKALELSPYYLSARQLLMNTYLKERAWNKLEPFAKATLQFAPDDKNSSDALLEVEKYKKTEALASNISRAPTPEKYLDLSLTYYQEGDYLKCIDAANEALKLKPDYAEAFNNIGSSYNLLKQYDKAIENLNKSLQLKPDFILAKNNLDFATKNLNSSAAVRVVNNVDPNAQKYIEQSLTYFKKGMYPECIAECNNALSIKPDYDLAYNNICAAYNKLGDWDKAIMAGERGLQINPANSFLKNNLAEAYKGKNNH